MRRHIRSVQVVYEDGTVRSWSFSDGEAHHFAYPNVAADGHGHYANGEQFIAHEVRWSEPIEAKPADGPDVIEVYTADVPAIPS